MATAARRVELALPHRRAGHCGSGALRDLLEFHGLSWDEAPLGEGAVFGLAAGLGFAWIELPDFDPPLYLVGRTHDLERDACTHLGIGLDFRQTDDPAEGWAVLRSELDAGRPTMIWADIQHLEYLRVRLAMTMHDIVVCGYDEEAGVALIADNDRDEIQHCSLEALARARNSDAFPGPNRHGTWVMRFPGELPGAAATVRTAVSKAVANMRAPGDGAPPARGLAGVEAFAAGFGEWPDRFGDRLDAALRGLRVFIVKAGTGGAMFRSLHAGFLHDAAALLGDPALRATADCYDQLATEWIALAAATHAEDPLAAHAAASPHVARIEALEHEGVDGMEAWLR